MIPHAILSVSSVFRFILNLNIFLLTVLLVFSPSPVNSQFTSSRNFFPASYPLAVRSPYVNTWWSSPVNTTSLTHAWPQHWSGPINGWSGFVRIDGVTWEWLGSAGIGNVTTIQSSEITPTRTVFTLLAGPMLLNISFFSPIETEDLALQSLPFTYLTFDCQSLDDFPHEVEVYSDISAEWISGNRDNPATWKTTTTQTSVIHSAQRQVQQPLIEISNIAEDGTVYYAMGTQPQRTWQSGRDLDVRNQFKNNGNLANTADSVFRAINQNFVVFGLAASLGQIKSTTSPVVWGLGLIRDPITNYTDANGPATNRRPYFYSDPRFANDKIEDVIDNFMQDYFNALRRADTLDAKIQQDALAASPGDNGQYATLVAMSARQALAGMEITFANVSRNGVNTTDVKAFLRNTGFDTTANNVAALYAAFPAYLYLNATWGGYLLDSLLEYQNSTEYVNQYAAPFLGQQYPLAPGDPSDNSRFGIEDTGSMLIMVLAHARATGNGYLIGRYYPLLKEWADYLVKNALHPTSQVSSDNLGVSMSDSTSLAAKGIIGIGAMAQISHAIGNSDDERSYSVNASTLALQWKSLAVGSSGVTRTYGEAGSFALVYDLYADLLLKTGLFDSSVYDAQASLIRSPPTSGSFGIPIDSSSNVTSSARLLFTAATAGVTPSSSAYTINGNSDRNSLINSVFSRLGFNGTVPGQSASGNNPVMWDINSGALSGGTDGQGGEAGPEAGGVFSLLALTVQNQTITIPTELTTSSPKSSSSSNAGVIAGAVVGSLGGIAIVALLGLFVWRRRRAQRDQERRMVEPRNSRRLSQMNQQLGMNVAPTPFYAGAGGQAGSYDPYNNSSAGGRYSDQPYGGRVLDPGATSQQLIPPAGGHVGFLGVESSSGGSGGSSEKRPFAPVRGSNWDHVSGQNQSGVLSERSDPSSPTGLSSASRSISSRYPQSNRSDASQLRQEVEVLRREMEEIRAAQSREFEPPPQYT